MNFLFLLISGYKGPVPETVIMNGAKYPIVFQLVSTDHPYYHIALQPSQLFKGCYSFYLTAFQVLLSTRGQIQNKVGE